MIGQATHAVYSSMHSVTKLGVPSLATRVIGCSLPVPEARKSPTLSSVISPQLSLSVTYGLGKPTFRQWRYLHNDVTIPNFDAYRKDCNRHPTRKSESTEVSRKAMTYAMTAASGVLAAYGAKSVVHEFLSSMAASADVLALAKIEIQLGDIPVGKNVVFKWRGKPVFVRHRPSHEINTVRQVEVSSLRDPQNDADRVQREEWLVVVGVCTHLGCVPIADAGEFGGYYCPCHGSHYDASGRIRKGPAPLNLEVPFYTFKDESTIVLG